MSTPAHAFSIKLGEITIPKGCLQSARLAHRAMNHHPYAFVMTSETDGKKMYGGRISI